MFMTVFPDPIVAHPRAIRQTTPAGGATARRQTNESAAQR
jgi:hypothetical protein